MTKSLIPTENKKKTTDNIKTPPNTFDYTTSADRLRMVSWSNNSNQTGVVKPMYRCPTFPLTTKVVQSNAHLKTCKYSSL